jgi:RND family efflux transporter MFP subunit
MKLRLLALVLLVAVGAGAVFLAVRPPSAAGQQGQLLTATATRRTITQDAVATGNVAFATTWGIGFGAAPTVVSTATSSSSSGSSSGSGGSSTAWTVTAVKAKVGATVKKGDALATATAADLQSQLTAANDQLRAAKNNLANATDGVNALTSSSSTTAVRGAWNQLYQARASEQSQERTIATLKQQLSYGTIKAPAAGVVTAVNATVGLNAPSGAAVEIGATPLEVVGSYAETDLGSLAVGQPAVVTVSAAGANVPGTVVAIAPTASTSSGSNSVVTYDVTIALTDPPSAVKPGMSSNVSITTASASDVIAIPSVALTGTAGGYSVEVVTGDGVVNRESVDVGLVTSSWAEIRSGLDEGDVVVTGTASSRQGATTTTSGFGNIPGAGGFGVGGGRFGGGNNGRGNGGNGGNGGAAQP